MTIVSIFVPILCPGRNLAPLVGRPEPRIWSLKPGESPVYAVCPNPSAAITILRDGKDFPLIQCLSKGLSAHLEVVRKAGLQAHVVVQIRNSVSEAQKSDVQVIFSKFLYSIYLFLERRREEERGKHQCVFASWALPTREPSLQPRYVPWRGIEPVTLSLVHSLEFNPLSHTNLGQVISAAHKNLRTIAPVYSPHL